MHNLGFWLCDKAGVLRELKSGLHPQVDPCCFPLLHPRGTLGWCCFTKKAGRESTELVDERQQFSDEDLDDQSSEDINPVEIANETTENAMNKENQFDFEIFDEAILEDNVCYNFVKNFTFILRISSTQTTPSLTQILRSLNRN